MKLARRANGFTLIELIVVIAVIGILATITVFGFTRFQEDGRDAQRTASVSAIVESLEKYFDENGEYPGCAVLTAPAATVAETLPGITTDVLTAPGESTADNSLRCEPLSIEGADFFEYEGDGSQTCLTGSSCLSYTLRYKEEAEDTIAAVESRRNTDVATSGVPVITTGAISFSTISTSWSPVLNAAQYRVQLSTNNTFDSNDFATEITQTSYQFTGLTNGTQYWIRVQAVFVGGTLGQPSNVISPTTSTLSASSLTATANSQSQITVSWGPIANAVTYKLYQATAVSGGNLVNPTEFAGITGTTSVRTGLNVGTTYYYQVRGVNGAVESPLSNIDQATTFVPAPTCSTATVVNNTRIDIGWSSVASATSYSSQRSTDNSTWTNTTSTTGLTQSFTGLNNGTTYYFRVQAFVGSTGSAYATCPSRTTGVSGPSSASWAAQAYGVRNSASIDWMPGAYPGAGTWWTNGMAISGTCSPGATVVTRLESYYAYSNNTSPNGTRLMDWTFGNQTRFVVGGSGSWKVWWRGWVACQVGSTRAGDTYLGNAGPY